MVLVDSVGFILDTVSGSVNATLVTKDVRTAGAYALPERDKTWAIAWFPHWLSPAFHWQVIHLKYVELDKNGNYARSR
jgi:hypothetical protein